MSSPAKRRPSNAFIALAILVMALVGPGLALALAAVGIAIAPPWTFLTGMIYPLLAWVGLPLGIAAGWTRRLGFRGLLPVLGLTGIATVLVLALVGPRVPTGMTRCQPLAVSPPRVRYACVSSSSDNAAYRYEFTLEGRANWPVLRLVDHKLDP